MSNATELFSPWPSDENPNATETLVTVLITENYLTPNTTQNPEISVAVFPFKLRSESWVIPLLVLSSINLAAILIFEVYVLYKSCGSRRHLFLGQILLLGLFLCSLLGYAFVLTPHWVLCALTRAGVGLVYSIVFSALLVKCLFLLGLHVGMYLNSAYQSLLLFFAIGVQVSISAQWAVYSPPELMTLDDSEKSEVCKVSPMERVSYLSYDMLLLFMCIVSAIRTRSLKENNREAMYIGISVGFIVVAWVSWTSVLLIFDRRFEDPAQGFGLVCTAIVVFLLVFLPKAIQLGMARRKNGSTNGSHSMIYAPSFLHLQPQAVLPGSSNGTLVKQPSAAADYCRGYSTRIFQYDYPTFHQMEPHRLLNSDGSSQRKTNVTFSRNPLY